MKHIGIQKCELNKGHVFVTAIAGQIAICLTSEDYILNAASTVMTPQEARQLALCLLAKAEQLEPTGEP
jgi:hypothetical protein